MKRITTLLCFLSAMLFAVCTQFARAQVTVFDPSVYGEEIENFGQLYNSNQSLLQQVEMGIQQYNLLDAQYQQVSNIVKYAMNSRNLWAAMPFNFNSQGRITGWGTTLDAGTYPSAYSALQQSQYQFNLASAPFLNPDRNNRYTLRASSVDLQNNALQDCLATIGNVRNAGLNNDSTLGNLIGDSDDGESALATSTAIAQKTSISTSILAQGQADANKQLACQLELGTAQLQQAANASAMELQDESNRVTTWAEGEQAGGAGSGSLQSSYSQMQTAAASAMGVTQ